MEHCAHLEANPARKVAEAGEANIAQAINKSGEDVIY